MRHRLLATLTACLMLPAVTFGRERPYSAHEFRLGMMLSHFRALDRFADLPSTERLVCSNDDSAAALELRPADELIQTGAIACGLLTTAENPGPNAGTIEMFGRRVRASFLFYQPTGSDEPRLTQILVVLKNRNFEHLTTLFRRTYGDSPIVEVVGGTLMSGRSVSNVIYTWRNADSTIQLEMYAISIDNARATFLYDEAWNELLAAVRRYRFGN